MPKRRSESRPYAGPMSIELDMRICDAKTLKTVNSDTLKLGTDYFLEVWAVEAFPRDDFSVRMEISAVDTTPGYGKVGAGRDGQSATYHFSLTEQKPHFLIINVYPPRSPASGRSLEEYRLRILPEAKPQPAPIKRTPFAGHTLG